jgi:hypothetical protein
LASAFCSGLIEIRADEPAFLRVFYQGIPRLDEGESQNKLLGNLRLSPPEISDFFLTFLPQAPLSPVPVPPMPPPAKSKFLADRSQVWFGYSFSLLTTPYDIIAPNSPTNVAEVFFHIAEEFPDHAAIRKGHGVPATTRPPVR